MSFPDWVAALDGPLPQLAATVRYALALAQTVQEEPTAQGSGSAGPGAKGKPAAAAAPKKPDTKKPQVACGAGVEYC